MLIPSTISSKTAIWASVNELRLSKPPKNGLIGVLSTFLLKFQTTSRLPLNLNKVMRLPNILIPTLTLK